MQTSNLSAEKAQEIASAIHARELLREKSRTNRKTLRENRRIAANSVRLNETAVGTNKFRVPRKSSEKIGFTKKNLLPAHFPDLINTTKKFIYSKKHYTDSKGIIRSLSKKGKRRLFEVLVVLLTNCDFLSGQVGLTKHEYMDTISHDNFMLEHAKRFGEAISSSSWYRYIDILKAMGIFSGREIKTHRDDGTTRSEASYKWLSNDFLCKIGVYKDENMKTIKEAYQKSIDKGYSFVWRVHNAPATPLPSKDLFSPLSNSQHPTQ